MQSYNTYKATDRELEYVGNLLNIEPNEISLMFFSDNNIKRINEMLIESVMIETEKRYGTKIKIEHQKKHLVTVIMRHTYFKNVRNIYSAQEEVDMLNKEVIRQMLPVVIRELIAYLRYIRDYNSIIPMERPRPDNRRTGNLMPFAKMFDFDNSRDIL